jgi:hypothetical protein
MPVAFQFDLPPVFHDGRQIASRAVQSGDKFDDRFLLVFGALALLEPASQERGIEFETVELVFEVMNDLN